MSEGKMENSVNDSNFKQEVLESDIPVLVDFWAEWCGPCKMIAPVVDELAGEYEGMVKVCKLNVDEAKDTASAYGIMSIPAIAIFKSGQEVERIVGAVPKASITAKLDAHI